MAAFIRGTEDLQMVFIPTPTPGASPVAVGPHTIFLSGRIDLNQAGAEDDDHHVNDDLALPIGPDWELNLPLQASAMVATAGIVSADSDEVDHSRWEISNIQTSAARALSELGPVRRIQLAFHLRIQGYKNSWTSVTFHLVANGTLFDPASIAPHFL